MTRYYRTAWQIWKQQNSGRMPELASVLGLKLSTVRAWGSFPGDPHVETVSRFTGIPVHQLVRSASEPCFTTGQNVSVEDLTWPELRLRAAANLPATLDNQLMGTPPPGRSALCQRKAKGEATRHAHDLPPLDLNIQAKVLDFSRDHAGLNI
jgi:hypothetical protein